MNTPNRGHIAVFVRQLGILLSFIVVFTFLARFNANHEAQKPLSEHKISLDSRQPNKWVNDVFKDNILLNLAYLEGKAKPGSVDWEKVRKPGSHSFTLNPNEAFSYHESVLPMYKDKVVKTTNAHFNSVEGFKSDGYLMGDGVCHLASLLYWAAKDAGLQASAPTNHDFAHIPEIPKEYGVAIYHIPGSDAVSQNQNLYIVNNKEKAVTFEFSYDGENLKLSVFEQT